MSTKEIQENLAKTMKTWQKIEDASVASTGKIIQETENPLIRLVMENILRDSQTHRQVQQFIVDSLEKQAVSLTPEEMSNVWSGIKAHIDIERRMIGFVEETLEALKGKKMLVQEYLLNYLREDEKKHDDLLSSLDKIKSGMYPYAS